MKRYFTLITCEAPGEPFAPQFGDYDKATVRDELRDYQDHGYKLRQLAIIESGDRQADLNAAVAAFNRGKGLI